MTQVAYSKDDVKTHVTGFSGPRLPAVNVKVYRTEPHSWPVDGADERMTREWFDSYAESDEGAWLFNAACESGREDIQYDAEHIFDGYNVKVWFEGRNGGWAVVDGLPELDEWDAVMLSKWRRFEKWAKDVVEYVPDVMAQLAYFNAWEQEYAGPFPIAAEHAS
jgi:hypothetical protein